MTERFVFHDCLPETREQIQSYWHHHARRLERLLKTIPENQRRLRLAVRHRPSEYDVVAALALPSVTLMAQDRCEQFRDALDSVMDVLALEIQRYRRQQRDKPASHGKQPAQAQPEESHAPRGDAGRVRDPVGFLRLIRPALGELRDHARRELLIAELGGDVPPGAVTDSDLIDEVIVRAWDRFDERPAGTPLNRWLASVLHEVLDEFETKPVAAESLEEQIAEPVPSPEQPDSGWTEESEVLYGEPEPVILEDTLASAENPEPWQTLDADEQKRWVLNQIRSLPRSQRRAFTLHAFDGWDPEEIARLQHRAAALVRDDVERTRQLLRERFRQAVP